MLARLPSKMAYGTLQVDLDGQGSVEIPRRELWDVRVQLMAEADGDEVDEPGLGSHDVKTGIYEGGSRAGRAASTWSRWCWAATAWPALTATGPVA